MLVSSRGRDETSTNQHAEQQPELESDCGQRVATGVDQSGCRARQIFRTQLGADKRERHRILIDDDGTKLNCSPADSHSLVNSEHCLASEITEISVTVGAGDAQADCAFEGSENCLV